MKMKLSGVIAVALAVLSVCNAAVISNIQPSSGSTAGGTLVSVFGSGFERGGVEGQTIVYIGNQLCETVLGGLPSRSFFPKRK